MSINACSINEYTINTLCGRRRQAIIDSLRPVQPPITVGGGQQQHVRNTDRLPMNAYRRSEEREEHIDVNTLEQLHMAVTVEINGQSFSQTLERETMTPVVSIYALSVSEQVDEQINISDFNIRIL